MGLVSQYRGKQLKDIQVSGEYYWKIIKKKGLQTSTLLVSHYIYNSVSYLFLKERKILINENSNFFLDILGAKETEGDEEEEKITENFEGPVKIPVEENIPNLFDLEEDDEEDEDEDKENLAGKFSSLYLNQCTQSNVGLLSELCGVLLELCFIMGLCQNSCAGSFPGLFIYHKVHIWKYQCKIYSGNIVSIFSIKKAIWDFFQYCLWLWSVYF